MLLQEVSEVEIHKKYLQGAYFRIAEQILNWPCLADENGFQEYVEALSQEY